MDEKIEKLIEKVRTIYSENDTEKIIKSLSIKNTVTTRVNTLKGGTYIQNPSSMIPVTELNPQEGEEILDLCAAPGSKTTLIADITKNNARITAVEKSKTRFFSLKRNLENYGATNVRLILANGIGLEKRYPELINHFK